MIQEKLKLKKKKDEKLSNKLYYRIGEVSEITGVPVYVLRFWETEFPRINPKRTQSGQRLYRKSDVELIQKIQYLLYEKKFTIQGAKQHLISSNRKNQKKKKEAQPSKSSSITTEEIKKELIAIRNLLS